MDRDNIKEPILEINEFETEAESVLDLAKKEALRIIQDTKDKANELIQKEKQHTAELEKEHFEKLEEELSLEKERRMQKTKDQLQRIENLPDKRIKQAVQCILEKVLPQ